MTPDTLVAHYLDTIRKTPVPEAQRVALGDLTLHEVHTYLADGAPAPIDLELLPLDPISRALVRQVAAETEVEGRQMLRLHGLAAPTGMLARHAPQSVKDRVARMKPLSRLEFDQWARRMFNLPKEGVEQDVLHGAHVAAAAIVRGPRRESQEVNEHNLREMLFG